MSVFAPKHSPNRAVRTIAAAAAVAGIALSLAACSSSGDSADAGSSASSAAVDTAARDLLPAAIKSSGTLTFASDFQYAPYDYLDNGKEAGFDYELGNAVAETLGLKSKWVTQGDFGSIVPAVQNGRVDAAMESINITPERLDVVDFVAYTKSYDVLMVAKGNPSSLKADDLCGAQLAAGTGGADEPLIRAYSAECVAEGKDAIALHTFSSTNAAILAVQNQQYQGMALGVAAANSAIKASNGARENLGGVKVLKTGDLMRSLDSGVVLAKGSADLGNAITAAMKTLQSDGTYDALLKKYDFDDTVKVAAKYVTQ